MTNSQRVLRLVNWALGVTLFTLAVVVCGFGTCQSLIATAISSNAVAKVKQETRPTPGSPAQAWQDWDTRLEPVGATASDVAGGMLGASALFVGGPIAILLIVIIILLDRLRTRLLKSEDGKDGGASRSTEG